MARAVTLLCVLLLGGGVAAAAGQPRTDRSQAAEARDARPRIAQSSPAPAPSAQSHTIPLDVIVDGNAPILTASDFSVTQAGEPLTIASARLVVAGEATTPIPFIASEEDELRAAAAADRLVAIYVDEYHLSPGAALDTAKSALAAFVRTSLGPRDLVVVVKPLASLLTLRLSADRESAARAIEASTGRWGDLAPRSAFEEQYFAADPARIEASRNQIVLSSLSALTTHLGRFANGRKTLIVLSDGLPSRARSRVDAGLPGEESIARSANLARVAVYMLRPEPIGDRGQFRRRASAPTSETGSGAASGSRDTVGRREPLAAIAESTTGRVMDAAVSAAGLQQVLGDASRYYLLDVIVPQPPDGQYRTVTITSRQPGVRLRGRPGYALLTRLPSNSDADTPARALARIPRRASRLIRVWFGQSAASDGRSHVVFVWEPSPSVPGARTATPNVSRVSVTITAPSGETVFAGETIASGRALIVGGAGADRTQATFDVASGTLLAQLEILDAAGRVLDKDVRDIVVRGVTASGSLGTAAVYRARTASDLRSLREDLEAAPVASRQFSRAESLVIRSTTPGDPEAAEVSARLVSGFGASLRRLDVRSRVFSNQTTHQVELPLAALATGQYAVEFTARSQSGTTVERVAFSVTP